MHTMSRGHVQHGTGYLTAVLCGFLLAMFPVSASEAASASAESPASHAQTQQQQAQLEQIVVARLKFYARHYPGIDFIVLDSAGDVARNMQILTRILGEDSNPLDYAHPADLRHDLLMAMLVRIQLLLQTDVGSATLFAPGKGALARRKQVCIVTLSPWVIARDDRAATRHLLEIPRQEFDQIPRARYLDHVSHLRFALDHEIYHCLDSSLNGPIPMSQQRFWGEYNMFRNEAGADTFAILMQMAAAHKQTVSAQTLAEIRGLVLLNDDLNHYTYPAIRVALHVDAAKLVAGDVEACFRQATRIRDRVVGGYSDYLRFAAAAEQAMAILGAPPALPQYTGIKVDHALVEKLVMQTRHSYRELTGHALPAADN